MIERHRNYVFEQDDEKVQLTIVRATGLMGMARGVMSFKAMQEVRDEAIKAAQSEINPDNLEAYRILKITSYPDLISPVIKASGKLTIYDPYALEDGVEKQIDFANWPISFEDFLLLPSEMILEWENNVYSLNPHWIPQGEGAAAEKHNEEKKSDQLKSTGD